MPRSDPAIASARSLARDGLLRAAAALRIDETSRRRAWPRGGVRVMNLHGTPARHAEALEAQLRWVTANFDVLHPQELLAILDGARPVPARVSIVLTFDDGLASNARVAAPLLERLGLRGLFFVNPTFAAVRDAAEARRFFTTRVRPGEAPEALDDEDVEPMDRATLRELLGRGHVIGNHTASHANLRDVGEGALAAEIEGARDTLRGWLDDPVSCFAWTFAWNAITPAAWAQAARTHRYCFTPCPGTNTSREPARVWRTNTECDLPPHAYRFFYSGLADPIWWRRRGVLTAIHASLLGA